MRRGLYITRRTSRQGIFGRAGGVVNRVRLAGGGATGKGRVLAESNLFNTLRRFHRGRHRPVSPGVWAGRPWIFPGQSFGGFVQESTGSLRAGAKAYGRIGGSLRFSSRVWPSGIQPRTAPPNNFQARELAGVRGQSSKWVAARRVRHILDRYVGWPNLTRRHRKATLPRHSSRCDGVRRPAVFGCGAKAEATVSPGSGECTPIPIFPLRSPEWATPNSQPWPWAGAEICSAKRILTLPWGLLVCAAATELPRTAHINFFRQVFLTGLANAASLGVPRSPAPQQNRGVKFSLRGRLNAKFTR